MAAAEKLLAAMRRNPAGVRFDDAPKVCEHFFFGEPRRSGGSRVVFETPWPGDPRVDLQRGGDGNAKLYQARQALAATERPALERGGSGT